MIKTSMASRKSIFGWAMFDFANSSYTTVIISVVFCVVFANIIVGPDPNAVAGSDLYARGNSLWSIALAISYFIVVLLSPIIGAITDFTVGKKRYLFYSYMLTILATSSLFFIQPGYIMLGIILLILSNIGFAMGENICSSFLPELGTAKEMGKVSGFAWGLGYFGGLISTILVVVLIGETKIENMNNLVFVGPLVGLFFGLAAIPTFLWVKEIGTPQKLREDEKIISVGFKRLASTMKDIRKFKDLLIFLFSVLFAQGGLSIVISFAFIYGDQVIHLDGGGKTLLFVITQFTAAGGAMVFGIIQDKIGSKKTYNITLILWFVVVVMISYAPEIAEFLRKNLGINISTQTTFIIIGGFAGLGLGSTQSASRTMVGLFAPEEKSGEFFGLWGFFHKLASIISLLFLGIILQFVSLKSAILICSIFFIIAVFVTYFINEERGKKLAAEYKE